MERLEDPRQQPEPTPQEERYDLYLEEWEADLKKARAKYEIALQGAVDDLPYGFFEQCALTGITNPAPMTDFLFNGVCEHFNADWFENLCDTLFDGFDEIYEKENPLLDLENFEEANK